MFQWMLIIASVIGQPNNEAERLFRKMEQKLSKAQTIECVFEIRNPPGKGIDCNVSLLLADGNKMRMEMDFRPSGEKGRNVWISDGTKLVAEGVHLGFANDDGAPHELGLPMSLNQEVVKFLTFAGFQGLWRDVIISVGQETEEKRFADRIQASGFKLGKKEKLNGRQAQVIEYDLRLEGESGYWSAKVWVDTKTNLLLKRVVPDEKGGKILYTETYTKMTVDGKIDDKKFRLPKK